MAATTNDRAPLKAMPAHIRKAFASSRSAPEHFIPFEHDDGRGTARALINTLVFAALALIALVLRLFGNRENVTGIAISAVWLGCLLALVGWLVLRPGPCTGASASSWTAIPSSCDRHPP